MYEHLKHLQPTGIPLLERLRTLEASDVEALNARFAGIPKDYLRFMSEVGHGPWFDEYDFTPYFFLPAPVDANNEHFKDSLIYEDSLDAPAAIGPVWMFALDSQGHAFCFDAGDDWRIVWIDTTRTVTRLGLSFRQLVEGLLVCYPQMPEYYREGNWFDSSGAPYSAPQGVTFPNDQPADH
ncbi:hypothetical protein [Pandoraea pnomenusa]|uniref:hypothetical protein n=1 Tax=Pandoraea pnomenusa TaxID=93220 RepID=UPI0033411AC9